MSNDFVKHETILEATDAALEQAYSCGHLTPLDAGGVAALRHFAERIDQQTETGLTPDGKLDNVSAPSYLKALHSLGMSPQARADLAKKLAQAGPGDKKPTAKIEKFNVFDKKPA